MSDQKSLQKGMRQKANNVLKQLSSSERETLLIQYWMSHDARWFMAVAGEFGIEVANRINKAAIREMGRLEAKRLVRMLNLPRVKTMDEYLLIQEIIIGLVGPDLLEYDLLKISENECEIHVRRCFAHENIVRAGIGDRFECGIFTRSSGWMDALGVTYEITPPLGKCLKIYGKACSYNFKLQVV